MTCYGAIDKGHSLTALGLKMSKIPLHPQLSKMLIMSVIFKCLDPIIDIAVVLNDKDVFELKHKKENATVNDAKKRFCQNSASDHLLYANLIRDWETLIETGIDQNMNLTYNKIMKLNCLNERVLGEISKVKKQLKSKLKLFHLLTDEKDANVNSGNQELIKGVILSGLFPQIRQISFGDKDFLFLKDLENKKLFISQKSVNVNLTRKDMMITSLESKYMAYFETKGNRKNVHILDGTVLDQIHLELFIPNQKPSDGSKVTNEIKFEIYSFIDEFLEGRNSSSKQERILSLVCGLLPTKIRENEMVPLPSWINSGKNHSFKVPKNFIGISFENGASKGSKFSKSKNLGARNRH